MQRVHVQANILAYVSSRHWDVSAVRFELHRTPALLGDHVDTGERRRVFIIKNCITTLVSQFLKRTINEEFDILRGGGGEEEAWGPYL